MFGSGWCVSEKLGTVKLAPLWNTQDTQDPPADNWEYLCTLGGWRADPSLLVRGGRLEPCREVKVTATGDGVTRWTYGDSGALKEGDITVKYIF